MSSIRLYIRIIVGITLVVSGAAWAADLGTGPGVGVRADDPGRIITAFAGQPQLDEEAALHIAWTVELGAAAGSGVLEQIVQIGAEPWIRAVFHTPEPIDQNLNRLESELQELVAFVKSGGPDLTVQAVWRPETGAANAKDLAYLIKRTAVAVTGAAPDATFVAGPMASEPDAIEALYEHEVAAYLDGIAIIPGDNLIAAVATLATLDPGKPTILDAAPWPADPTQTVALAAEFFAQGIAITFFEANGPEGPNLAPLKVLANELAVPLSYAPYAAPSGGGRAWAFVREDLGMRIIVEAGPNQHHLDLLFGDSQLRNPMVSDLFTGATAPPSDHYRTARGLTVAITEPTAAIMLSLERPSAAELEGYDEVIDVAGERQMPVEEILRRLQAFEDAQDRRLDHFQATSTLHLRFQGVRGAFEASYSGDFFFQRGAGFDWVWKDFFIGGIKWRSKRLPEVPLVTPEKAAALPVEIRLSQDYAYRLRRTDIVDGRDCWVIDFKPITVIPGRSLYQGTVWVDREIYARVRTRAIQLGLEGEVISNEETQYFTPIDETGQPAAWSSESFILPLRIVGQQTLSILSATIPLELQTDVTDVRLNDEAFAANRKAALASDLTMVRDTDEGLRYLKKNEDGDRVVETERDTSRLFLLGGVFWDESVDYPLPLLGVNYLDLDFLDTGAQLNVFFAGVFLNAGISDPELFGSRWNGGANLSGIFFKTTDELYRDGAIAPDEDVESRSGSLSLFAGRPLGSFLKLDLRYLASHTTYDRADETAEDFVIPQSTLTNTFRTGLTYTRAGYRLGLAASYNSRADWEFWGLPDNLEYDPDQQDFTRWQVTFAKTFWFKNFRKIGLSAEHLDGANLDRFSGYDFGLFGDSSVAGYQSGLVRAQQATGVHASYGINWLDQIGFEIEGDAVWASNELTGLDNELLAGIGIEGSLTLPWQLLANFEVGYALAGPGEGNFAVRIFFLKLFPED